MPFSTFTLQPGQLSTPGSLGQEKTAAAWGLNGFPALEIPTSRAKQISWRMIGADPLVAPPFTFEQPVVIRQYNAAGVVTWQFQGRCMDEDDEATPGKRGITLTFQDRFYDLDLTPFMQAWPTTSGDATINVTRAYLFQDPNAQFLNYHVSVAAQIQDIIAWAQLAGVDLQAGVIDNNQVMPWYAVRGLSCLQALETCQKFFPNMRMWIDDSTAPPTFNCRFQANLANQTMQWAGADAAGRLHLSSKIKPLHKLQASAVQLQWQVAESVNDQTLTGWQIATWPVGNAATGLRAIVLPLDIKGFTEKAKVAPIVAAAFNPASLDYWRGNIATGQIGKLPHLADANVAGLAFTLDKTGNPIAPTITDKNGNIVNLATYPNEHKSGSVFEWMKVPGVGAANIIECKVEVHLTYNRTSQIGASNNTFVERSVLDHVHTSTVKLTNSPVGLTWYSALTNLVLGETPIAGLEEALYNDRAILQHDGTHSIKELNAYTTPITGPWNTLTLAGGRADWVNMGIASVRIDFFHDPLGGNDWRNTTITLGPAKHLSPQDFNAYCQLFRGQFKIDDATQRITPNTQSSLDIGGNQAKQDTTAAIHQNNLETFASPDASNNANTNVITHNPAQQVSSFTQYTPAGTVNTTINLPRVFSGAGQPNATTLIAGMQYQAGTDLYFDATKPTAPAMYVCSGSGSNQTSTWVIAASGGGFPWQAPKKELDPTVAVGAGIAVYVSPLNPLVTIGLVDLDSNILTFSRPGIWLSLLPIPAMTAGKYNVPQVPYPTNGTPLAGMPASGDLDSAKNYWALISPTPYC